MEQWLNSIPKPVLVISVMLIGLFFVWFNEPPKDYCANQLEVFKASLEGITYPGKAKRSYTQPKFKSELEQCKASNSIGGCYAMFTSMREILQSLDLVLPECQASVFSESNSFSYLKGGLELMVQIAWGEGPPGLGPEKFGWIENSELILFCKVQSLLQSSLEEEDWDKLKNSVLSSLPQVEKVPRSEVFNQSLFSAPCRSIH